MTIIKGLIVCRRRSVLFLLLYSILFLSALPVNSAALEVKEGAATKTGEVNKNNPSIYYPLAVGNYWEYGMGKGYSVIEKVEVTEFVEKADAYFLVSNTVFNGNVRSTNLIGIRKNKVLDLGFGGDWGGPFKLRRPPLTVLVFPLKIGKTWEVQSDTAGQQTCKVIEFLESYPVKAGSFENVWKISCTIYLQDKKTGKMESKYGMHNYYAPDVGLIKQENIKTGEIFKELLNYKNKR